MAIVSSHNEALNYLKKLVREKRRDAAAQAMFDAAEPADSKLQEMQYRLIEAAIEQLPTQARRVFQLVRFEGNMPRINGVTASPRLAEFPEFFARLL